jgi:hypothetical protein
LAPLAGYAVLACQLARPRGIAPVRLLTSPAMRAATASISGSVMVFSCGCSVIAVAVDFLPGARATISRMGRLLVDCHRDAVKWPR